MSDGVRLTPAVVTNKCSVSQYNDWALHPVKTQISLDLHQTDQSHHCELNGWLRVLAVFIGTVKILIRLGECQGSSESSLDTKPNMFVLWHSSSNVTVV